MKRKIIIMLVVIIILVRCIYRVLLTIHEDNRRRQIERIIPYRINENTIEAIEKKQNRKNIKTVKH